MQVVSVSPFQVASLTWQPSGGRYALTVVAKGTFELAPGHARLAATQDVANEHDNHWNDDSSRSIYCPSDMAPFKRKADVVLVGEAFSPGGEPARSVLARLSVGTIDKVIEVACDRFFGQHGELTEGERFARMPLRYERAAGGPHGTNPVGIDREGERDRYGRMPVPNLVRPGVVVNNVNDLIEPVGFGPIASSWPTRRALLGKHAHTWSDTMWQRAPIPADIDFGFFNVAPLDQRVDELRENERIVLENLHPYEARLVCHLPGYRPRAFVERHGAARDLPMIADTLWIDTSRSICTVTWRGRINLDGPNERGRVYVGMEKPGVQLTWATVRQLAAVMAGTGIRDEQTADGIEEEHTAIGVYGAQAPAALPFRAQAGATAAPVGSRMAATPPRRSGATSAIPLVGGADAVPTWLRTDPSMRARPASAPPPSHDSAPAALEMRQSPWAQAGTAAPVSPAPAAPPATSSPPPSSSVSQTEPGPAEGSQPAAERARAASGPAFSSPPPIQPLPPVAVSTPLGAGALIPSPPAVRPPNPMEALYDAPMPMDAPSDGLAPHERVQRARAPQNEIVELIWHDSEQMSKIRSQPTWAEVLAELAKAEHDEPVDFDEAPPPEEPPDVAERRDVVAVMTRAIAVGAPGMEQAMLDSVDPNGHFDPPMVLASGKLEFPFDQLETLKATLAAVTPLIAGNKELQDTVDAVKELMQTPWLEGAGAGEVAEGLTEKVRAAFKRGDRIVDPGYLDSHTERILLERRCYQRRTLLGGKWIRALLAPSASKVKIPTYIPEALATELPMFTSFAARVIGEAHVQQDQYETHTTAIKVAAFGRVIKFTRSPQIY